MGATPALVWISLIHARSVYHDVLVDETIKPTRSPVAGTGVYPYTPLPAFHFILMDRCSIEQESE